MGIIFISLPKRLIGGRFWGFFCNKRGYNLQLYLSASNSEDTSCAPLIIKKVIVNGMMLFENPKYIGIDVAGVANAVLRWILEALKPLINSAYGMYDNILNAVRRA